MEKTIEHKKIIVGLLILGALIIGSTALASLVDWPNSPMGTVLDPGGTKTGTKTTLPELIRYLYEWAIGLGGIAAFISLIIAGFEYLTSTGDPTKMNAAKDRIIWAIGGLVLLLGSWLILNIINPQLIVMRLPPLDMDEKIQDFSDCTTADDCPDGLVCVCSFPEELTGQLGIAGKECTAGYCSAIGPDTVGTKEHLCDRVSIGVWQPDPAGGGNLFSFNLNRITECVNISDLPFGVKALRGGGVIYSRGYKDTGLGEEACGPDSSGRWSDICQECQKTRNPEACDLCCSSCFGKIVFYHEQRCISEFITIDAGDHYIDLSEDVYSVKFLPPYHGL